MRKIKFLLYALPLMLLLTACPYSSEVALDEKPSVKIDEKLIGEWESKNSSDNVYKVQKKDQFTYSIDKINLKSNDTTSYIGFISDVSGTRFLNVYESENSKPTYYAYKMEMTNDYRLKLLSVTENIQEKFATSKEYKDFVKKNMSLSFFFDKSTEEYLKK